MLNNFLKTVSVLGIVMGLVACQSNPKKASAPVYGPVSHQASFIEASNNKEVLVRATGQGNSVTDAVTDAKKSAIWFVLFAGETPLITDDNAKKLFESKQAEFWNYSDTTLRHVSGIKAKRQQGDTLFVDVVIKVDRSELQNYLVKNKIIEDTVALNNQFDYPSISIQSNSPILSESIASGLQQSGFNLVSAASDKKQIAAINQMSELEGIADPEFNIALAMGADVVIKSHSTVSENSVYGVTTRKANVALSAYDSVTQQILASATGYSADRKDSSAVVVKEAANDAVLKLRSGLEAAWAKQNNQGKIFKIVLMSDNVLNETNDLAFFSAIKSVKQVKIKRLMAGSQMVSYWLWSKDYQQAFDLYRDIKSSFHGAGRLNKSLENGRLLMLKLEDEGEMTLQ